MSKQFKSASLMQEELRRAIKQDKGAVFDNDKLKILASSGSTEVNIIVRALLDKIIQNETELAELKEEIQRIKTGVSDRGELNEGTMSGYLR